MNLSNFRLSRHCVLLCLLIPISNICLAQNDSLLLDSILQEHITSYNTTGYIEFEDNKLKSGEAIERHMEASITGTFAPDSRIGEDAGNDLLWQRNMSNPDSAGYHFPDLNDCTNSGKSVGQPDTYRGDNWIDVGFHIECDKLGVHVNNGVNNLWFNLLSGGGTGVNDNLQAYNIFGIGFQNALDLTYLTMTDYLTPTSTYEDAMVVSIALAKKNMG